MKRRANASRAHAARSPRDPPAPGGPQAGIRVGGGSVSLAVRAQPGARRDAILGWHGEALKVAVQAQPERGRANEAILEVLAAALDLPRSDLELVAGKSSRDKRVRVLGVTAESLLERIERALPGRGA